MDIASLLVIADCIARSKMSFFISSGIPAGIAASKFCLMTSKGSPACNAFIAFFISTAISVTAFFTISGFWATVSAMPELIICSFVVLGIVMPYSFESDSIAAPIATLSPFRAAALTVASCLISGMYFKIFASVFSF